MSQSQRPPAARHAGPHVIVSSSPAVPAQLPPQEYARLREEAALVERYVDCYRRRFDAVIQRLNAAPRPTGAEESLDAQSIRLCVEAVSMMLATHGHIARVLRGAGTDRPAPVQTAARLAA